MKVPSRVALRHTDSSPAAEEAIGMRVQSQDAALAHLARRLGALATHYARIGAFVAATAAGCAPRMFANPEETPRPRPEETPPQPAFSARQIHEQMWRMARDVERINVIMRRSNGPLTAEEQAEIVSLLADVELAAGRLAEDDARVSHPVLGENIDAFREDIAAARRTAAASPPNFFLAGTVAGACANCHGPGFNRVN